MNVNDLVLVQGMADTKRALRSWQSDPIRVLGPWVKLSFAITLALLTAVYVVAKLSQPDPSTFVIAGLQYEAHFGDFLRILFRNSLVLALHAMACVAGFMAGSSLPLSASKRSGFSRWIHEKAGPFAIAFVVGATLFSLSTQAFVIGNIASTAGSQLDIGPGMLLIGLLPHAIPELMALFLPLAAWIIASRRDDWHVLLAATFVTVAIAAPVLLGAAAVELYVSPELLRSLAGWG